MTRRSSCKGQRTTARCRLRMLGLTKIVSLPLAFLHLFDFLQDTIVVLNLLQEENAGLARILINHWYRVGLLFGLNIIFLIQSLNLDNAGIFVCSRSKRRASSLALPFDLAHRRLVARATIYILRSIWCFVSLVGYHLDKLGWWR